MAVGLLAESSPLLGQCLVASGEVGGSLFEQRQQTAEQGVSFVLHAPFVMPQINKYLIFLLMSLRSELSSSCKPQLTTPCALGVCAAGQGHCAQEWVTLLPSLGFPISSRST